MQAFYFIPFVRFLQDASVSLHDRIGSDFMRAKPVATEDQYRLVMECRASGLTDYQWCMEHGIKPGTFYNWVKRLRQKGAGFPPNSVGGEPARQEVVKLDIPKPQPPVPVPPPDVFPSSGSYPNPTPAGLPVIELSMAGTVLRIPQQADPAFLGQLIRILRDELC